MDPTSAFEGALIRKPACGQLFSTRGAGLSAARDPVQNISSMLGLAHAPVVKKCLAKVLALCCTGGGRPLHRWASRVWRGEASPSAATLGACPSWCSSRLTEPATASVRTPSHPTSQMPKTKAAAPPEVDAPAAKAVGDEKVAVPAAGNNAKKQLSSMFNRVPKPAPKHVRAGGAGSGGDATALSRAQGIVLRVRDDKPVNGPKGPITKRRIDLLPTSIMPNGAQDIVRSGVPGQTFLFPSRVLDTPDAAGAGDAGGYRAKERELVVSPLQTVRQISIISASFYKESKEGGDAGVMSLKVGMMAEVSGICVNASTKGGVTNFYLNAGKVTPMADSGPVGADLGRLMVQHASSDYMQQW